MANKDKPLTRVKPRNYVAKFSAKFNKAQCHENKKAAFKQGKIKHKGEGFDLIERLLAIY